MTSRTLAIMSIGLIVAASSALAITPGNDLLIAGAARTSTWVTDLYINNPGPSTVQVTISWLVRDQANPSPASQSYSLAADNTLILKDVILNQFGLPHGLGAFRITVAGGSVTANAIVSAGTDSVDGSYGSGFEAVPAASATGEGETTRLMGLANTADFYTNLFALAGADGAVMDLDLVAPDGAVLDTATVTLDEYEPWLTPETDIWDVDGYDNATAEVRVVSGSVVIMGSRIDRTSGDPATLESAFGGSAASSDGTYQFAAYDFEGYASGGYLVISGDEVDAISGTYINFDKVDGQGNPTCTLLFLWGFGLIPTAVEDFESGVELTDVYPDGGSITWTVTFTLEDNTGFSGTLDAVGSNFSDPDTGCNGSFPTQILDGGKSD